MRKYTSLLMALCLIFSFALPSQAQDITNGIISCWDMEETSGTRTDSVDANDFTDVNTVGSATGKINTAASFVATNQEELLVSSTDFALSSADFTFTAWVRFSNTSQFYTIASKGEFTAISVREMFIYLDPNPANGITFALASDGFNFDGLIQSGFMPSPVTWYFIAARHDTSTNQMMLRIDSTPQLTAFNAGAATASNAFRLGSSYGVQFFHNGDIDSAMFWNRALSTAELDLVYNSGNGIGCDSLSATPGGSVATQLEIALPSGGTGVVTYEVSAGEAVLILAVAIQSMFIFYQMLQGIGRGSKIK